MRTVTGRRMPVQVDATEPAISVQDTGEPPVLAAADPTSIEVYCDIRDASMPDKRIVGTFVNPRAGYGDPTVTFTLYDLSGIVYGLPLPPPDIGQPLLPGTNRVTGAPPYPNNWEWGPGAHSTADGVGDLPEPRSQFTGRQQFVDHLLRPRGYDADPPAVPHR